MTSLANSRPAALADSPAHFRDLLAAEWIKLRSLRSTTWVLALSFLAVLAINVDGAYADYQNYPSYGAGIKSVFTPWWAMRDAFNIMACEVLLLVAGTVGALSVCAEYGTGLIRVTFAAVPARRSVLAAKAVVVSAAMLVLGAAIVLASFLVTQAILSGRHVGLALTDHGVLRMLLASTLVAPLAALVGMGIGGVLRHTATSAVGTTFLLALLPFFVDSATRRWVQRLHDAMPLPAWQRLVEPGPAFGHAHRPTVAAAWLVFAAWPLVAMVCAAVTVHRRDV